MVQPSIGRIVWFYPHTDDHTYSDRQVLAALVTAVHSDTCINLAVFAADGTGPYARTSVYLQQDDAPAPINMSYAAWMPYQKGQAAKTEQIEATLAAMNTPAEPPPPPPLGDSDSGPANPASAPVANAPQAEPPQAPGTEPVSQAEPQDGTQTNPAPTAEEVAESEKPQEG